MMHLDGSHSPEIQSQSITDIAQHSQLRIQLEEGHCRLHPLGHTGQFPQQSPQQVYHYSLVFSAAVREGGKVGEGEGVKKGGREGRIEGRGKREGGGRE